jgi:hypothetical protein
LYLALFVEGVEVSGDNYSRKSVTNNTTNFPNAVAGVKNLHVAQTFATPSGNWGEIDQVGVFDASSAGNLITYANPADAAVFDVLSGEAPYFPVDSLQFTLD